MNIERVDPKDEATFREICTLLLPMEQELALVPVDPDKAGIELWKGIAENNTWVVRIDGKMVGVLILIDRKFWQNPAYSYLANLVLYVDPGHRFALVGRKLLQHARENAMPATKPIVIEMLNRHRRPRPTGDSFYAAMVGYLPIGHQTMLRKGHLAHVDA